MPDSPERLVDRLVSEGQKTLEFFSSIGPVQWECRVYSEGSCWTVLQVFAHFVATESAIRRLIENVLGGGPGAPQEFDIDAYNERKVAGMREFSADDLLRQFSEQRDLTIDLVKRMSPQDLFKTGRHPFLGVTTLEEIIKLLYRHNQIHQRDLRRLLSASDQQANSLG